MYRDEVSGAVSFIKVMVIIFVSFQFVVNVLFFFFFFFSLFLRSLSPRTSKQLPGVCVGWIATEPRVCYFHIGQ